ncbi:hypothetical protein D0817_06425 [Flavobacterium cupreum]|uniref:Uncharacterized protein n=1 Tax=Flavobacterium cupreum TaxID=2133766 RepID=A0A434AAV4_9FLAO|nr:hypothetical protein [Flavobacterium cupreum]RUT71508.1 hypothetical protein D0817_06425 [Flavobacterium cupreum]
MKLKPKIIEVVGYNATDKNNLKAANAIDSAVLSNSIALLFTQIVSYVNSEDERPQVATIYLKEDLINVYFNKKKAEDLKNLNPSGTLTDVNVEISFYGGFIEKIQVNGKVKGADVSFNNKFSIGISATKNIGQFADNRLYSNERFEEAFFATANGNKGVAPVQYNKDAEKRSLFISASDVIRYVKKVDVNANDISPVPQLVLLDENQKTAKLYKEESSKLFEATVYTDFFGVFDEASPNGIIQTEVNKRFNVETSRFDMRNKCWGLLFPPFFLAEGVGFFQFFDAKFQYSKIEKNNKFLLPQTYEEKDENGNVLSSENYYSPLSLYQHKNFAIGGIANLMTLENQNAKANVYLNAGFLFGRSGIKETALQETGTYLSNLEIPIECNFHLLPEKRVSFILGDRLSWFDTFDSNINLKSIEDSKLTSKNKWLNSFNVDVNVDISSTGKLFLRYKLIHELDNINNNFSQLQFGYSFFLLQSNGVKKKSS